jgi:hypothetical protein
VTVNGNTVLYPNSSAPISLSIGANVIDTVVVSQDTTVTNTYTITVTRAAASSNADLSDLVLSVGTLSPAFNSNTLSYTATVPYQTSSLMVTATTADLNATLTAPAFGCSRAPILTLAEPP